MTAYAVALKGTDCSNDTTLNNKLLTGGCKKIDGSKVHGFGSTAELEQRCREATADSAFMLLGFIMSLVVIAFSNPRGARGNVIGLDNPGTRMKMRS